MTGQGSSFRLVCKRNSVVYFFKFAPISGQANQNKVASILTLALVKRKLHSSRWFFVFILYWSCFVCFVLFSGHKSTQVSRNPKCGCQMWVLMERAGEERGEVGWMLTLQAWGKGVEFHKPLKHPDLRSQCYLRLLVCSLYLKQNEKPQGDSLPATNPMSPKSAEILFLFPHDRLKGTKQRIMSQAGSHTAKEELRC